MPVFKVTAAVLRKVFWVQLSELRKKKRKKNEGESATKKKEKGMLH